MFFACVNDHLEETPNILFFWPLKNKGKNKFTFTFLPLLTLHQKLGSLVFSLLLVQGKQLGGRRREGWVPPFQSVCCIRALDCQLEIHDSGLLLLLLLLPGLSL